MIDDFQLQPKYERWPCACVKRDKRGNVTHIKEHAASVVRCRRCGSYRSDADRRDAEKAVASGRR